MDTRIGTSAISIDAAVQAVWTVLADEFIDVAAWGPGVNSSVRNPETPEGLNGSRYGGRICEVEGLGKTTERIVAYDAQARTLSYTLEAENLPPFIKTLEVTWTASPDGAERCTVDNQLQVTVAGSMVQNEDANKAIDALFVRAEGASTSLKTYIESGNHHATGIDD